jgi:hypothetical protein
VPSAHFVTEEAPRHVACMRIVRTRLHTLHKQRHAACLIARAPDGPSSPRQRSQLGTRTQTQPLLARAGARHPVG